MNQSNRKNSLLLRVVRKGDLFFYSDIQWIIWGLSTKVREICFTWFINLNVNPIQNILKNTY